MRKSRLIILFSVLLAGSAFANGPDTIKASINGKIYVFELSDTPEERKEGLMFRERLDLDSGMLFVFEEPQFLNFYMKNTPLALDIAFLDSDCRIIDIQPLYPYSEEVVTSKGLALYALEVNRGFFQRAGLGVSDKIEFLD